MKSHRTRFKSDDIFVCILVCVCVSLMCLSLTSSSLTFYPQSLVCSASSSLSFAACKRREGKKKKKKKKRGMVLESDFGGVATNAHVSRAVETDREQIFTMLSGVLPRRPV